ncbi:hypothetical protein POPTR_010G253600v4 [Populus trichocarpa]|uniref:Uncharacterized protein n=1 Tax=Populus trichocarpa TaxID=3694 RepID=A0ACC0SFI2_POPTR|nr:hypothetical protein BDE02_10G227900 [Populus trichocarpa]KAI9387975.1 hypothetical protein POPTR_010G253600v4 [Populus trichocarpa]
MDFETESQKKKSGVFGDVYGGITMVLPKEIDDPISLPSPPSLAPPFELRFHLPDLKLAVRDFTKTREVGEFLSGALAGAMTKAVLAPLETIRTRMVAGNAINMLRIIPTQAIELGTFECVKRAMTSAQEKWSQSECPRVQLGPVSLNFSLSWISPVAAAGAAAGIVSTLACHPLEVLKDRLTVSRDIYPNLSIAISKIYKDGGIGAFYAGISPTLMGMLPYSTCYYFMYETMKTSYCEAKNRHVLTGWCWYLVFSISRLVINLRFGCLGFTASTLSFPLEVARKRLMEGAQQGKCPPHMAAALSEVIREEGLRGLYRGWGASCLKVMPSSGITWMFYEAWKDVLLVEKQLL